MPFVSDTERSLDELLGRNKTNTIIVWLAIKLNENTIFVFLLSLFCCRIVEMFSRRLQGKLKHFYILNMAELTKIRSG